MSLEPEPALLAGFPRRRRATLFNQLVAATDPRGSAPSFDPPLGIASPERYTARTILDYQEGDGPIRDAEEIVWAILTAHPYIGVPLGLIGMGEAAMHGDMRGMGREMAGVYLGGVDLVGGKPAAGRTPDSPAPSRGGSGTVHAVDRSVNRALDDAGTLGRQGQPDCGQWAVVGLMRILNDSFHSFFTGVWAFDGHFGRTGDLPMFQAIEKATGQRPRVASGLDAGDVLGEVADIPGGEGTPFILHREAVFDVVPGHGPGSIDGLDPGLAVNDFDVVAADAVVFGTGGTTLIEFGLNSEGQRHSELKDRFTVGGADQVPITALQFRYVLQTGTARGACCVETAPGELECLPNTTPDECAALSGTYLGDFTSCGDGECGAP